MTIPKASFVYHPFLYIRYQIQAKGIASDLSEAVAALEGAPSMDQVMNYYYTLLRKDDSFIEDMEKSLPNMKPGTTGIPYIHVHYSIYLFCQ